MYTLKQQISIYAGEPFYWSKVWVEGLQGDEALVTGIVNLHNLKADTLNEGNWKAMSTWGNQAMNGEVLGMAVIFHAADFKRYWEAPDSGKGITSTHLVSLALHAGQSTEYAFVASWELQDTGLKDKPYFEAVIRKIIYKIQG
jgi:hypothetical protein